MSGYGCELRVALGGFAAGAVREAVWEPAEEAVGEILSGEWWDEPEWWRCRMWDGMETAATVKLTLCRWLQRAQRTG